MVGNYVKKKRKKEVTLDEKMGKVAKGKKKIKKKEKEKEKKEKKCSFMFLRFYFEKDIPLKHTNFPYLITSA